MRSTTIPPISTASLLDDDQGTLKPRLLKRGDRVRFLSPGSTPDRDSVMRCKVLLESWGLVVEIGQHAFECHGFFAGTDDNRLADLNSALRDPGIRAIFATRGGKGSYRIADRLDFDAAQRNRPFVVGFSDVTVLHLALWNSCRLVGLHGPMMSFNSDMVGPTAIDALRRCLMTEDKIILDSNPAIPTAMLTTSGNASGPLLGGNLDTLAIAAGWTLPPLSGAIWLLEGVAMGLGHVDRQLTMLARAGHLDGLAGVAVGEFIDCSTHSEWTVIDVLKDHLHGLGVPVIGGLAVGHGRNPRSLPIGASAFLDADSGTLTIEAAGRRPDAGLHNE
jgi:muramoyltetrapeptide carboxypeptidase